MTGKTKDGAKFTGRHMLWLMLGAFAVVAAVNGVFIYAALESWTGLAETDAYAKGLAYNHELDRRARQEALGWHASLSVRTGAEGAAVIELRLSDKSGAPLTGAEVNAELRRPTQAKLDRAVHLSEARPGLYTATTQLPAKGQWDIRLTAERGGEDFRAERRISVF